MNYKALVLLLDYLCWLLFAILEFCVKAYMVRWSMHVCLFHCNFDHPKLLELTNKVSIMFGKQTILFPLKEYQKNP